VQKVSDASSLSFQNGATISPFVEVQIYFDFDGETINEMNPEHEGKGIYGITCTKIKSIYIGARHLLDPELKLQVHGTLVHELFHQAIFIRYGNDCKPYEKGDMERSKEYKEAVRETRWKFPIDDLFERALRNRGGPDFQEAEIIVRPMHAEALYANNEIMRARLERNYGELYAFYHNRVLPDIDQGLADLHKRAKERRRSTTCRWTLTTWNTSRTSQSLNESRKCCGLDRSLLFWWFA
jgi:hypothetical protein